MSLFITTHPQFADVKSIRTKHITVFLIVICSFLVLASIAGNFLQSYYPPGNNAVRRYVNFFDLNKEANLPALFSTILLLSASLLNFLIFTIKPANRRINNAGIYWFSLGAIFLFLYLDESLQVHEKLNSADALKEVAAKSSFFYYAWVVPYAIGVLLAGIFFFRFLRSLPLRTRKLFIAAGIVYVCGALGFEFLESYIHVHLGKDSPWERVFWTTEEAMEMMGIIIFIDALLGYIALCKVRFEIGKV